jgi:hypothetical protein
MKLKSIQVKTAILGFIGLAIQFYYSVSRKLEEGYSFFYGVNHFFTYFTILVNTMLVVLLISAVVAPEGRLAGWFRKSINNAGVALYVLVVGIIFYGLLYNSSKPFGLDQLATHILHGYIPIVYFFMWFFNFRQSDLLYKNIYKWLLFPLFYFAYVLIRGAAIGVYPYFFVNVDKNGYSVVGLYAVAILLFFLLLGSLLVWIDRKFKKP